MRSIFYAGPYTINYKPMILKPWTPALNLSAEFLTEIPLWVKFPNIPMGCWGSDSLSRIASAIGAPLFADECTTKQSRITFARMLVQVDVTKPLPTEINVMDPFDREFEQAIEYNWKPQFCDKCLKIGHVCPAQPEPELKPALQQARRRRSARRVVQNWQMKGAVPGGVNTNEPVAAVSNEQPATDISGAVQQPRENDTMHQQVSRGRGKVVAPEIEFTNVDFPFLNSVHKSGTGVIQRNTEVVFHPNFYDKGGGVSTSTCPG
ncbi:hypothetical protein K7X08_006454 [Anisodus acutangulus]|uniref:DUF4283 domain-containing protein n=1 Tax=Anisodus acutangulus TaxID=402998 RepID=A0A9Q1RNW5_9SOLA|nr:hypothetical protein K7X08_006454 [Anisodus acutangulus]